MIRILLATCAALAVSASVAVAAPPRVTPGSTYLALGDSVTFGYQEPQVRPAPDYSKPSTFVAYPALLGAAMHLRVVNAACPGETSASLINPNAPNLGCENLIGNRNTAYRPANPLHVRYRGSQLAFALSFLRKHPKTRLVSLMIGANDGFLCQETTSDNCASTAEQLAVAGTIQRNVHRIVSDIRRKARYRGQLVILHYYSLDYTSSFVTLGARGINASADAGAKGFGARSADGFGQFRRATAHSGGNSCTAGLLTQLSTGGCGVHPSYSGQALLALALARAIRR